MTLDAILEQARAIWGPDPTPLAQQATVLTVVVGDIARQARASLEGDPVSDTQLAKELGNLVLTAVRFMDDHEYHADFCIDLAAAAQARYQREAGP